jgi:dihydrodipicolinate synthase/N-acetylneuraminate lyase
VDGAQALARWRTDTVRYGLVVAGSTGEAATLTDEEKKAAELRSGGRKTRKITSGEISTVGSPGTKPIRRSVPW